MDLQKMVDSMNKVSKETSAREYSLGKFIKDLKELDQDKLIYVEEDIGCDGLDSWRGSYCELSMQYEYKKSTVGEVLKDAERTLDSTLTGYKGGDFLMDKRTPIHIANYGESSFPHKNYERGMMYTDDYEPEKKNSKENYMTHCDVKLIGIEDKGEYYQLKLRKDEDED